MRINTPRSPSSSRLRVERLIPRSLLRYGIVGVVQNGAFYLATLALIGLGWPAWQAVMVLNPIAVGFSFLANRNWSFAGHERDSGQLLRYVLLYGITYVLAIALTWVLERVGVPSWLAAIITILVAAACLYLALKFWVFRASRSGTPPKPD